MKGLRSRRGKSLTVFAEDPSPAYMTDFLSTSDGLQLMRAFVRVRDGRVRKRIVDLVEALAEADDQLVESPGT